MQSRRRLTHDGIRTWGNPPSVCFFPIEDRPVVLVLAMFVLFVLSVPKYNLPAVITYASFPVLLIIASKLPAMTLLKRLAIFSPFVFLMASANPFFDRQPFFQFSGITITGGMMSGMVIIAKTMVTMTAVLSISLCLPFYRLGKALRGLGVPEVFVTQLLLVYRYSFLLVEEAGAMQKARDMRAFGGKGKDLFTTAKLIGSLLIRTTSKAERIYMAMTARGFKSKPDETNNEPYRKNDIAVLIIAFLCFMAVRMVF